MSKRITVSTKEIQFKMKKILPFFIFFLLLLYLLDTEMNQNISFLSGAQLSFFKKTIIYQAIRLQITYNILN